jgi:fatty-acyl-CoA synthase
VSVMPTTSYTHNPGRTALSGLTVGEHLRGVVSRQPHHPAIISVHQRVTCTYQELWDLAGAAARAFLAHGIGRGETIALWSPNRYEWTVVQLAAARIGAVLVSINPACTAAELAYALNHCGARLLVLAERFRSHDMVAIALAAATDCPALERSVVFDIDWAEFCVYGTSADELARHEEQPETGDPVAILYTSGTTGLPKGATLSHHNVLNNALLTCGDIGFGPEDRVCMPAPFFHCFGMVLGAVGSLAHGSTLVLPGPSFDPLVTLQAVHDHRCTALYGVPTMFVAQLAHERFAEFDLSSLRTGLMGGAPCPPELVERVRDEMHLPELSIISGMTETSPTITQTLRTDPADMRTSTVGRPSQCTEVKIVDPVTGRTAPIGTPGELCARGYQVMLGYWNNPAATRQAIDDAGWMHSGDLATMDDQGCIRIVGRIKDVIIRGGENVYPREIEDVLHTHPDVVDAQVIGIPDPVYGEQVMAWIRTCDSASPTSEELRAHCAERLSTPKVPVRWRFVDEYPQTASGKVQKYRLRQLAVAELETEQVGG